MINAIKYHQMKTFYYMLRVVFVPLFELTLYLAMMALVELK